MGCIGSSSAPDSNDVVSKGKPENHRRNVAIDENSSHRRRQNDADSTQDERFDMFNVFDNEHEAGEIIFKGIPFETIVSKYPQSPKMKDMEDIQDENSIFMIEPFKYNRSRPDHEPKPINYGNDYIDRWDQNYVRMPCSQNYISEDKRPIWLMICKWLDHLQEKCNNHVANFEDLKTTIEKCSGHHYDMECLEQLINKIYSDHERAYFMTTTLSKICDLVLTLTSICTQPPPLLRIESNRSVTMSQRQAASLLACAFFCLFPFRSDQEKRREYENYQNPNFNRLYQSGPPAKVEKLKCILNYFRRVTEKMPNGVITIQRFALHNSLFPAWSNSIAGLCDLHLTTGKKIEEVDSALQVDFANKYIGGGVLGSGCVQEEIRFTICPEMLVSLLVCEKMETNECVFLIGCERYSSYKGYARSFQFAGNYDDKTSKDNWGRKWCHLVAMDAIFFRDRSVQYDMKYVDRELIKAYTSFRPLEKGPDGKFSIATGNWGCGAFNGDRQLKAIIQLMAASEAGRPLIYAAYRDKNLVNSFSEVYNYLIQQRATVGDLYYYLYRYSRERNQFPLFQYILSTPVSQLRS